MFNTFSWYEFIQVVALTLSCYYIFLLLVFYRMEISISLKGINRSGPKDQYASIDEDPRKDDLLGRAMPETTLISDHVTSMDSENLYLSISEGKESSSIKSQPDNLDALLIGSVADLLEEIKTLVQVIVDCEGDKEESNSMFQTLLAKFPQIADTKFRSAINLFIREECKDKCDFELTIKEIDFMWP